MDEANRKQFGWKREMTVAPTNLSLENDRFPRDLLRGFRSVPADNGGDLNGVGEDDTAIELNLGLSLGGRFGVDKAPGKLKRSSSVLGTVPFLLEKGDSTTASTEAYTVGLTRTTSLPAEMEDEWWKRKEVHTVRRMEAKRRRCGKETSLRVSNGDYSDGQTASFEMESLITDSKSGFLQSHLVASGQGSIDSDGGGGIRRGGGGGGGSSSSISDLDNKNQQGSANSCVEERSPNFIGGCSSQERNNRSHGTEKPNATGTKSYEKVKQQRSQDTDDRKGKGTTAMLDMPCVFTKGGGSNGRRVDGILYKYGKGEEVRIMCICHGSFLTPSEFVKHAGGEDVDHPLRHIVVNTSATFS